MTTPVLFFQYRGGHPQPGQQPAGGAGPGGDFLVAPQPVLDALNDKRDRPAGGGTGASSPREYDEMPDRFPWSSSPPLRGEGGP